MKVEFSIIQFFFIKLINVFEHAFFFIEEPYPYSVFRFPAIWIEEIKDYFLDKSVLQVLIDDVCLCLVERKCDEVFEPKIFLHNQVSQPIFCAPPI